jgi:hypothetical protein
MRVRWVEPAKSTPTAMHEEAEKQLTPSRSLWVALLFGELARLQPPPCRTAIIVSSVVPAW